jgi:DNA-directed RNA polymerase specialized sigma24 family protein
LEQEQELAQGLPAQLRTVGDEDAVQDGFIRVVRRQGWASLKNPHGYWYATSRNALRDRHRRRAAEERAIRSWLEMQPRDGEPENCPEGQLVTLRWAVGQLQGLRRQLIELELSEVREVRALAFALGISEGATRVLRHRTYRQLREVIRRVSRSE